jgi:RNA polymerase primary sigma factor
MENLLQFKPGFKGNYAFIRKEEAIEHTESDHLANNRLLELFSKIKMGDPKAVETLSVRFIRLVINIADDFKGNGLTDLELVLNGNAGLIKAAEKFDISRGIDFEAYAIWSVRQQIIKAIDEHEFSKPLPLNKIGLLSKNKYWNQNSKEQLHQLL